jgi:DtxR family Mn-dependent transcriptional regulator
MRPNLSTATEDYLKSIYELTLIYERASTNQIAERLGLKPGTVTGMLKRLATSDPPLLVYHKHRGVALTAEGERIALEMIRHHRLLELYLHDRLGYSWDMVHEEADRLEHVISEDFEERIARELGDPLNDPHGDPIPTRELQIVTNDWTPMSELRVGQQAIVQRVADENPDLLRYLSGIGLVPQARLTVTGYSEFDGNLQLKVADRTLVLGPIVTRQIEVEVI